MSYSDPRADAPRGLAGLIKMDVDFAELEREFQLDNDPDEEFEVRLQESYKQHKGPASRPLSSSSNRPQTASRSRPDFSASPRVASGVFNEGQTTDEVYLKISRHLTSQLLDKTAVVRMFKEFCTFSQFKQGFSQLGLELTDEDVTSVFQSFGVGKTGMIRTGDFAGKIILEENDEDEAMPQNFKRQESSRPVLRDEHERLREEAQRLLEHSQKRLNKPIKRGSTTQKSDCSLKRPFSSSHRSGASAQSYRPISAYNSNKIVKAPSKNRVDDLDNEMAALEAREASLLDTRGKQFLMMTKKRQENHEKELATTVDRCRREFEYDCLHKMGEANEIAQTMGLPTTYRAIKKENGVTMCHIYNGENFVEEITLENFLRESRRLKRLQKPAINPQPSADKSLKSSTTGGKVNKKERQEELKNLLLETKELTNKLKEQLKVLERKGIIAKSLQSTTQKAALH
jgi:hypothetical protein